MRVLQSIGVIVLLASVGAPVATVEAQTWGRPTIANQFAYDEGYRQGLRIGQDHARRGLAYNVYAVPEYQRADLGYRSQYGNRENYRRDFRTGFEQGYRASYDRSRVGRGGGPPGPPPWSNGRARGWYNGNAGPYSGRDGGSAYGRYDLAAEHGFGDGYNAGFDDGRDRRRFDPIAEGRYRSGDHGYERSYGSKEFYKDRYRDAFRDGYARGYQDSR